LRAFFFGPTKSRRKNLLDAPTPARRTTTTALQLRALDALAIEAFDD
jgi:hypothetical protein